MSNSTSINNQTSNNFSLFHFDGCKQIRTMFRPEDDAVLFCGKDVAEALGYKNTRDALNKHCKRVTLIEIADVAKRDSTSNGVRKSQEMIFIPESDVYRLIMKSRLKTAEKFEEWVCDEVLPTIRKHGVYSQSVASSGLSNKVQALQLAHTEKVLKEGVEILKAVDKSNRYGRLKPRDCKTMCENLGQYFNIAPEIIELINKDGLQALS
ncbi:Bro-N domain-containing protein [Plesiomonas shigelloides]|uniref:BRO-N domain-containing protein n=1 Tax=Plesiomonas shigelloides TaxID=703 RepID=UPI001C498F3A|nr:BRO family protein [Plesiomonas shigelloides]